MDAATGIVANALTQLAKGQDPRSQWQEAPGTALTAGLLRGGGLSIVGDFLFSEFNRHGKSLSDYGAGFSISSAGDVLEIFNKMKRGENPAGDLIEFVKGNTPFQNMWFTKVATDYLLWNGLQEWANPGYLKRSRNALKKNQGIEFLRTPIDMAPENRRLF